VRSVLSLLSVSELTRQVRDILESEPSLQSVWVRGEVSNLVISNAGHAYFTLKDAGAQLRCVIFRNRIRAVRTIPPNGSAAVAQGRIIVYEPAGNYQLHVAVIQPAGVGDLYLRLEETRARLEAEGLFAPERKRLLPRFPRRVGVVTSPTGAVIRDIVNILGRRFPLTEIVVSPTQVQGADAPPQICRALSRLERDGGVDVIIVARGGGSIEDLWPFNDERVARAIYACSVPVVSAIGHETDFTIADQVADVRAPTPSAAAELVAPDARSLTREIDAMVAAMTQDAERDLDSRRAAVERAEAMLEAQSPDRVLAGKRQRVDDLTRQANAVLEGKLILYHERIRALSLQLAALDPKTVLARGYSHLTNLATGATIGSIAGVAVGDNIRARVSDGAFTTVVTGQPTSMNGGSKRG
jgi:exodeoxyribonuclease VII large subunit